MKASEVKSQALALLIGALMLGPAWAADRPFLATSSAAAEEDDDGVWAIETWWLRRGKERSLSLAPEYAFDPWNSLQIEITRTRAAGSRLSAVELEAKHLFNSIARDGWGAGLVAAAGLARGNGSGWRRESLSLRLPLSIQLGDAGALLHLNAGVDKPREGRRELGASTAIEVPLARRGTALFEAARSGEAKLLHAGWRQWITRERFAVDIGFFRERDDGRRRSGVVVGLAWFDL